MLRAAMGLRPVAVASAMVWFDRWLGVPEGVQLSPGFSFNTWADMAGLLPELGRGGRSALQLVVAPMDGLAHLDDAALAARLVAEVRALLPQARRARVEHVEITRTPQAFHAVLPGADALRPPVDIGLPGLLLAGDHVGRGRSPNMESALTAGAQAGQLALEALG